MKIAWLFPGQGAQAVGMGKELAESSTAARQVFVEADEALGEALSTLCFEGPLGELTLTANTQPAIVATSAAILAAIKERHPQIHSPAVAAGHSLGEYSALCAAGSLGIADAVRITRVRGEAMQRAVPAGVGAMAAVMKLDGAEVAQLCIEASTATEIVSPANFNAPSQTVVAGHAPAVERASSLAKERGGKVIPLKVSAPFHCALMTAARERLVSVLEATAIETPAFDVLANVDAEPKGDAKAIRASLSKQIDSPVQWVRTVEQLRARGVTHALEIGPGRVLAGLCRRVDKDLAVLSVAGAAGIEKITEFLELDGGA